MLAMSSSGTRRVTECGAVRSNLTPLTVLLSKVEELDVGFLGTVTFGKLPKVKVKLTVASIWMLTLAEKTTPVLAAIKHNV